MSAAIQIEAVLKSENRPMYLHEIREAIVEQFGAWHSESAISARIRDSVRPKLLAQGVSLIGKAPKGKSAWQYSLVNMKKFLVVGKVSPTLVKHYTDRGFHPVYSELEVPENIKGMEFSYAVINESRTLDDVMDIMGLSHPST